MHLFLYDDTTVNANVKINIPNKFLIAKILATYLELCFSFAFVIHKPGPISFQKNNYPMKLCKTKTPNLNFSNIYPHFYPIEILSN